MIDQIQQSGGPINRALKDQLDRTVFPRVQNPIAYVGGELNSVRKDPRTVAGRLCLAFPDLYTIGMSNQGLQVLYTQMNQRADWACERVYAPMKDMEQTLRGQGLPLYSLETFTPLGEFDVLGFSLQYEISYVDMLTMLDLANIPLRSEGRTLADPLVLAGGPCAQNPEPVAPFIDVFVTGDGEPALPLVCERWLAVRREVLQGASPALGEAGRKQRADALARLAATLPFAYVPSLYEPEYDDGRFRGLRALRRGGVDD